MESDSDYGFGLSVVGQIFRTGEEDDLGKVSKTRRPGEFHLQASSGRVEGWRLIDRPNRHDCRKTKSLSECAGKEKRRKRGWCALV